MLETLVNRIASRCSDFDYPINSDNSGIINDYINKTGKHIPKLADGVVDAFSKILDIFDEPINLRVPEYNYPHLPTPSGRNEGRNEGCGGRNDGYDECQDVGYTSCDGRIETIGKLLDNRTRKLYERYNIEESGDIDKVGDSNNVGIFNNMGNADNVGEMGEITNTRDINDVNNTGEINNMGNVGDMGDFNKMGENNNTRDINNINNMGEINNMGDMGPSNVVDTSKTRTIVPPSSIVGTSAVVSSSNIDTSSVLGTSSATTSNPILPSSLVFDSVVPSSSVGTSDKNKLSKSASPCMEDIKLCGECYVSLATIKCNECILYLCAICSNKRHNNNINKLHKLTTTNNIKIINKNKLDLTISLNKDIIITNYNNCNIHLNYELKYTCITCNYIPTCIICINNLHINHNIIEIDIGINNIKELINDCLNKLINKYNNLSIIIPELDHYYNIINININNNIRSIKYTLQRIYDLIKLKNNIIYNEINNIELYCSNILNKFLNLSNHYNNYINNKIIQLKNLYNINNYGLLLNTFVNIRPHYELLLYHQYELHDLTLEIPHWQLYPNNLHNLLLNHEIYLNNNLNHINNLFNNIKTHTIHTNQLINHYIDESTPEVTASDPTRRGAHTLEVQSNSLRLADSSPNYLSLKGIATPGDRGRSGGRVRDVTSSGVPAADLREAKGEVNRESCLQDEDKVGDGEGRDWTSSGENGAMGYSGDKKPHESHVLQGGMKSSTGPRVEPVADLREAEGQLNREGLHGEWKTSSGRRFGLHFGDIDIMNYNNGYKK